MQIDTRFPTKLDCVSDAPEPLQSELVKSLPLKETVRLVVHVPAFSTGDEKSPATLLAVTNNGWLVASEAEDGEAIDSPVAASAEEPKETLPTPMPPKAVNPTETPAVPGNVYEFADVITFVPTCSAGRFTGKPSGKRRSYPPAAGITRGRKTGDHLSL
jgi:hypothetical protein